jgi:TolB protein
MVMRKTVLVLATAALAVLLASGVALVGLEETSQAAFPGKNGRIAYAVSALGQYPDIYTMNPDGSDQARYTSDPGNEGQGAWSPDGTKMAFLSQEDRDRTSCFTEEIYIKNADGSNQTRLTNNELCEVALDWSPDGTRLVFGSLTIDPVSRRSLVTFYTINADGSNQTRLTTVLAALGPASNVSWSPDGTKIAYAGVNPDLSGGGDIYTMNPDGTNQIRLTNTPGLDYLPDWSPDGSKIAFTRQTNPEISSFYEAAIYTMNPDGSGQTPLTDNSGGTIESPRIDYSPTWAPDGTKLAFSRVQGPYPLDDVSVYTINVDGSGLTRLTSDAPSSREFVTDWQPLPGPTGPKTKADCKNGGYKDFGFKNQGECIKAVKKAS